MKQILDGISRFFVITATTAGLFLFASTFHSLAAPGDLDPSFGNGGKVITPIGNGSISAIAIQSDGKIVASEISRSGRFDGAHGDFAITRYSAAASLDTVPSAAATIVTNTSDSGPGSLRDAIAMTPAGGTVNFALGGCPCTIVLTSGDLQITKNLTVIGPGADQLTISGNNVWRPFRIGAPYTLPGPGPPIITVVLDGLGMTNGLAGAWPSFSGLDGYGGGLIAVDVVLTIRNSIISNNFAARNGGGIASVDSNTTIINSTISRNVAPTGGGISHEDNCALSIIDSIISDNRARGGFFGGVGGGIYSNFFTNNRIINSSIARNEAGFASSAYIFQWSTVEIVGSTVEGNTSGGVGGTLVIQITTTIITNSTISGNTSLGGYNAGVAHENFPLDYPDLPIHSQVTITNTTITNNRAADDGGGVTTYQEQGYPSTTTLRNSIVADNVANSTGTDLRSENGGAFASSGYNLIGNADPISIFNQPGDQIGTRDSPIDPKLLPLALNGGPTKTHALKLDSPALDRGIAFDSLTDQRGLGRPNDDPNIPNAAGGDGSDIGAFEARTPLSISGRVTTPDRRGLRNATVTLTDSLGVTRTATTSSFGFYTFDNVSAGETYVIGVSSRLYRFALRNLIVNDNLTNVDFVGQE